MAMEKYHFEHEGQDYALTKSNKVKASVLYAASKEDYVTGAFRLLLAAAGGEETDAWKALIDMENEDFFTLFREWSKGDSLAPSSK